MGRIIATITSTISTTLANGRGVIVVTGTATLALRALKYAQWSLLKSLCPAPVQLQPVADCRLVMCGVDVTRALRHHRRSATWRRFSWRGMQPGCFSEASVF